MPYQACHHTLKSIQRQSGWTGFSCQQSASAEEAKGRLGSCESWRQRALMGERWKRGFLSSCFHHRGTGGRQEKRRIMAAKGRVNLQDLFALLFPGLTNNVCHPERKVCAHLCACWLELNLCGRVFCELREAVNWEWEAEVGRGGINHYYISPAETETAQVLIIWWLESKSFPSMHHHYLMNHSVAETLLCCTRVKQQIFPIWHEAQQVEISCNPQ